MKKQLLIVLAMSIGFLTYAQQGRRLDAELLKSEKFQTRLDVADPGDFSSVNPYKPLNNTVKGKASINKYQISSSANAYTLIINQSHCLTADQPSGVLMFTHRADPSAGLGSSSGDIVTSHSTDAGVTWNQNIVLTQFAPNNNRYPSGVLYNPLGAMSVDSLMAVWCGPSWEGTTGNETWDKNYFGNSTLNGAISNSEYITNLVGEEPMIRMGFSACDDGYVHVMGPNYDYNATTEYTDYINTIVMNGTYHLPTNSFNWSESNFTTDFVSNATDGDLVGSYNMQWSQDGSVGWIYFTGRDNRNDQYAYQPIAYYSLDKGDTWTIVPWFDYGTIPEIYNNFWPLRADTTRVVPTFYFWNDGVVDANGQLHIFLNGQGKFSVHADSINWSYTYEPDFLIDLHTTMNGWDAVLIDTVWTDQVLADESGFGTGDDALGWTHRTQASRSKDGTKIFVVWSDTDTLFSDKNKFPDIKAWGLEANTGEKTDVVNFTKGTSYAANNFFQFVSNISLRNGCKESYTIPVSVADLGQTPDDPVGHYYLSGIELEFSCGVAAMFTAQDTVVVNSSLTFTDASTGNPNKWEWDFGDGGTSTLQNPIHDYTSIGTYTVTLTAGDDVCCTTYEMNITVKSIGISEKEANINVDIYPNPTSEVLNISTTEIIENVKIFNVFGHLVSEELVGDKLAKINTSSFSPGIYFIQINTERGFITRKVNVVE